ncbi:MAG: carboxypeptidase-like regulatory domain-containing protein, partial [Duncaniella sp.]|nr:carboxypeptidase-like regulatory domain-containing protein [Duncaniella sp.]
MYIKLFIAFLISVLSTTYVSANPRAVSDANIVGHVVDKETGDHMPGCLVQILNTDYSAMTDASGHYTFRDLKPGNYEIQVSFMGYRTMTKSVSAAAHRTIELTFAAEPDAFMLAQVVVPSSKTEP